MIKNVIVCDCCNKPVGINHYKLILPNFKNNDRPENVDVCEECNHKIAILLSNMYR